MHPRPTRLPALQPDRYGAAALGGHTDVARALLERTLQFHPSLSLADGTLMLPIRQAGHAALWQEGLCRAGVPES
jgi:hypothetical protein